MPGTFDSEAQKGSLRVGGSCFRVDLFQSLQPQKPEKPTAFIANLRILDPKSWITLKPQTINGKAKLLRFRV